MANEKTCPRCKLTGGIRDDGYHSTCFLLDDNDRLRSAVQEAATLLDMQANLGPVEHRATLREVVRQLTAALNEGAMSDAR